MKKNQKTDFDFNPLKPNLQPSSLDTQDDKLDLSNGAFKLLIKSKVKRPEVTPEFIQNIKNNVLGDY